MTQLEQSAHGVCGALGTFISCVFATNEVCFTEADLLQGVQAIGVLQ
jgi:ammonia channel protein AmtB